MLDALHDLAVATENEDKQALDLVDVGVAKVLRAFRTKRIAFMREVSFVTQPTDDEHVMWLCLGLPILGWAPPARGLMERVQAPAITLEEFSSTSVARNAALLQYCKSSGDTKLEDIA